jgi:hypothetical protein
MGRGWGWAGLGLVWFGLVWFGFGGYFQFFLEYVDGHSLLMRE